MGITDCEGIDNIPGMAQAITSLAKVSVKLKTMIVIADAEDLSVDVRVQSIIDSLRSKGASISDLQPLMECNQVYRANMRVEGRVIILMMAVSGDFDLPFKKHGIEDHGVRLLLLKRVVEESELYRYESAKHIIVDQSALLKYIDNSDKENVKRTFSHLYHVLKHVECQR
jgi:hypothetical protein